MNPKYNEALKAQETETQSLHRNAMAPRERNLLERVSDLENRLRELQKAFEGLMGVLNRLQTAVGVE